MRYVGHRIASRKYIAYGFIRGTVLFHILTVSRVMLPIDVYRSLVSYSVSLDYLLRWLRNTGLLILVSMWSRTLSILQYGLLLEDIIILRHR